VQRNAGSSPKIVGGLSTPLVPASSSILSMIGLVFEDAPSGIRSGRTAGCKTVAFLTTHSREQVQAAEPDFIVNDMSCISMKRTFNGVEVVVKSHQMPS